MLLMAANRKVIGGTKRELATNAVLALRLSGFNPHRRANNLP